MRDLTRELRVGTCCGKCVPEAKAALKACLTHRVESRMDGGAAAFFGTPASEFAV
jgi:NAD(P)H-nitrite reductase large subunit